MKYRKTKIITRSNCPETNSSSSHSFVWVKERFKESDLLEESQTIKTDDQGKVIFDGGGFDLDDVRCTNDSYSKAFYAIASTRLNFCGEKGKRILSMVLDVIKDTLGIKDIVIRNKRLMCIDHQSRDTLKHVLEGGYDPVKEFIFNPRVWLYLLWDSEDEPNNIIYDHSPGYFKYEISVEIPKVTKLFGGDWKIDNVYIHKPVISYPRSEDLYDFWEDEVQCRVNLQKWKSSYGGFDPSESKSVPSWRIYCPIKLETSDDPEVYEFIGFRGKGSILYASLVRSSLWKGMEQKLKTLHPNLSVDFFPSELAKEIFHKSEGKEFVYRFTRDIQGMMTDQYIDSLGLTEEDLVEYPITIYSREEDHGY